MVANPDIIGREAILKVHVKKSILVDVKLRTIAEVHQDFQELI